MLSILSRTSEANVLEIIENTEEFKVVTNLNRNVSKIIIIYNIYIAHYFLCVIIIEKFLKRKKYKYGIDMIEMCAIL